MREATIADLDALVAGNHALALESEGVTLDESILRPGVRAVLEGRAPATYYVVEEGGQIVAQLMITHEWSDWRNCIVWWIQSVYVSSQHRQRGLFRRLYEGVVAASKQKGAGGIRLYVDSRNVAAQETYRRLGMNGDHYRVFEEMWT